MARYGALNICQAVLCEENELARRLPNTWQAGMRSLAWNAAQRLSRYGTSCKFEHLLKSWRRWTCASVSAVVDGLYGAVSRKGRGKSEPRKMERRVSSKEETRLHETKTIDINDNNLWATATMGRFCSAFTSHSCL